MLSLPASVICVPVHLCGCLRPPRVHSPRGLRANSRSRACVSAALRTSAEDRASVHARTDAVRLMEKFSPQRKPLSPLSSSLSLDPVVFRWICLFCHTNPSQSYALDSTYNLFEW